MCLGFLGKQLKGVPVNNQGGRARPISLEVGTGNWQSRVGILGEKNPPPFLLCYGANLGSEAALDSDLAVMNPDSASVLWSMCTGIQL